MCAQRQFSGSKFVNTEGIFSYEAGLAALLLIAIILAAQPQQPARPEKLLQIQKLHDLLIVWAMEGTGIEEMEKDAQLFLGPGTGFAIEYRGEKVTVPAHENSAKPVDTGNSEAVSDEIIYSVRDGIAEKIRLSIMG